MNNKSFLKFSINLIIQLFFFDICCITALFIGTEELAALLYHVAAAFRATLSRWLLPGHEITLRIILTAVITSSLLGLLDDNIFSALRTCYSDLLQIRLGVLAVREARAGQEFAVRAVFDYHIPSTYIADDVGYFVRDLYPTLT